MTSCCKLCGSQISAEKKAEIDKYFADINEITDRIQKRSVEGMIECQKILQEMKRYETNKQ